jgi:hypothetical protein
MEDAVAKLDSLNARSLKSTKMSSAARFRFASGGALGGFSHKRTDTRTDTGLSTNPQVIEGRVAQLAEQLTLNQ